MRDASLIPLTHDHHHSLAAIRRLVLASHEDDIDLRLNAADSFLGHFSSETLDHFREEEEELFPLIIENSDAREPLIRVLIEHIEIHLAVKRLRHEVEAGRPSSSAMARVADLLEGHIRFEEKVLFPLAETVVGAEGLRQMSLRPRRRAPSTDDG